MLLADHTTYASTISGYVITGLLTVLTTGFLTERAWQRREIKAQNESLGLLQQAQAVLVHAMPATQLQLERHDDRLRTMEIGYTALSKEMERHSK